jgi:2-dehydropantoate 2-reductase
VKRLGGIVSYLRGAGFAVQLVEDARPYIWGKTAINAAINPLTALLGVPNGYLVEHPSVMMLMQATAREAQKVAEVSGVVLPYADAGLEAIKIARATRHNRSSMLQDIERGSQTEIDVICGAICLAGRKAGVETPYNQRLLLAVKALEQGKQSDLFASLQLN